MLVARDPLWSSSNSYPSVRMAGDSLKHPDILTPLILLDLPFSVALDTVIAAKSRRPKIGQSVSAAPLTKEESAKFIEVAIRKRIKKPVGELTDVDLEKVKKLDLNDNQLTDVKGLEKLTQLKVLNLSRNPDLTKAQIAELRKALPNCEIYSSHPLTKEESAKVIEKTIRKAANKPTGTITKADLEKVTRLALIAYKLTDVKGLEKLT